MKALIAMSGGVDSSVAAYLAKSAGYECIGAMMRLFDNGDAGIPRGHPCCSLEDASDARAVAVKLGMPFYVFNFTDDFRREVIGPFARAYLGGATPNPCIECNRRMKFGALMGRADIMDCGTVVTGHYARIESEGGKYVLKKAADETKDQSYVLYFLTQAQLARLFMPLGGMTKPEVRALAAGLSLVTAHKHDSQDICFAPDGDYARTIEIYTGAQSTPGDFLDGEGNVLGRHRGLCRYTLGQRRGLGVAAGERLYVTDIDPAGNAVTLGKNSELYSDALVASDFSWVSGEAPGGRIRAKAKIRYRQNEQPCMAEPLADGFVRIVFDRPQRAVTKGQAAVLYEGDTVLGGGTIM